MLSQKLRINFQVFHLIFSNLITTPKIYFRVLKDLVDSLNFSVSGTKVFQNFSVFVSVTEKKMHAVYDRVP